MDMHVFIVNLGKYNEGESVGAWFTPPIHMEYVQERIGLNGTYEEYAIHDYELPFDIGEYTPIEEVNRLCEMAEELSGTPMAGAIRELQDYFGSFEELMERQDDIIYYPDCNDMEDVAIYLIEETGILGEIPGQLQGYIDYKAFGRDLELNGGFLVTSHGIFEIVH
ncbi:antirestriction protein ArdA [Natribacillus halophilus]|uniref:Antirestriction protein (ArdA) n=1 Tax=Natribacillus halophilus TaxID=549003 RepID=A0A1G8Q081_9BACI|nr:antirestriction protein ArdA [Natribacillus halophilus]SDI97510.1 Antirestriction protein (ArdA) [Natribacillus halophilus]